MLIYNKNNILNELNGEKIELVEWNEDLRVFVKNALYPAELNSVEIVRNDEDVLQLATKLAEEIIRKMKMKERHAERSRGVVL